LAAISAFFTAYSGLRDRQPVEVIAVGVTEDAGELRHYYVVVDEQGSSSIAQPDELNLYGVIEDAKEVEASDDTEVEDIGHPV
jgi:hypothetical protein